MPKKKVWIIPIVCVLVACLIVVSIWLIVKNKASNDSPNNDLPKETVTVIFDSEGGTAVSNVTIEKGSSLLSEYSSAREGYSFFQLELRKRLCTYGKRCVL